MLQNQLNIYTHTGNRDHESGSQHIYTTTYLRKKKPVHGIHETRTPKNVPVNETILDPTV